MADEQESDDAEEQPQYDMSAVNFGAKKGHLFRRAIHFHSVLYLGYFWFSAWDLGAVVLNREHMIVLLVGLVGVIEYMRLKAGLTVFGQRWYERTQVSALAWAALGVGATLILFQNYPVYAFIAVMGMAIIDPVCGMTRHRTTNEILRKVIPIAIYFVLVFLVLGTNLFGCPCSQKDVVNPIVIAVVMASVAVFIEPVRMRNFDDDFTMVFFPAVAIFLVHLIWFQGL